MRQEAIALTLTEFFKGAIHKACETEYYAYQFVHFSGTQHKIFY